MKFFPTFGLGLALLGSGAAFAQPTTPPAVPPASDARPDRGHRAEYGTRMFELFDVNRDGRITFEEAWTLITTRFTTADADRSGGLSLQEFGNLRMRRADAPTPPPERAARMEQMRGGMFRALDANSDGQVALDEIRPAVEARFRAADANADGAVTREELPQRGHHHGHHHGHRGERMQGMPGAPASR